MEANQVMDKLWVLFFLVGVLTGLGCLWLSKIDERIKKLENWQKQV
jgi:hypothetical protein